MSTYTVKTREAKSAREFRRSYTSSGMNPGLPVREEYTIHIVELFLDNVVVCSGNGVTEEAAFADLDWSLHRMHVAQMSAFTSARYAKAMNGATSREGLSLTAVPSSDRTDP